MLRERHLPRFAAGGDRASNGANFAIAATDAELSGSFSGDQFIGQDLGVTNFGGPGQ